MTRRRGQTMLEVLLALGLLAAVTAAVASWIRFAGAASVRLSGPVRWEAAASTTLQVVADDLLVSDMLPKDREPRCELMDDGDLVIRTRLACTREPAGMVAHRYGLDAASATLRLQERSGSGAVRSRALLGDVAKWTCELDEKTRVLTLRIESREGRAVERRLRVP